MSFRQKYYFECRYFKEVCGQDQKYFRKVIPWLTTFAWVLHYSIFTKERPSLIPSG